MKSGNAATRRSLPLAILLTILLISAGCAHRTRRQVSELRSDLAEARASCVHTQAPDEFARAAELTDRAAERGRGWRRRTPGKLKIARAALEEAVRVAARRRDEATGRVRAGVTSARESIARAESAGADEEAASELDRSRSWLAEATRLLEEGPCGVTEAEGLAADAEELARRAERIALDVRDRRALEERQRLRRAEAEEARRLWLEEDARRRGSGSRVRPGRWVVSPGECLWLIAADVHVFGDPFQWPLIYRSNKDLIGDPDLIYPGQSFLIPRNLTVRDRQGAIREARERIWPTPGYLYDGK